MENTTITVCEPRKSRLMPQSLTTAPRECSATPPSVPNAPGQDSRLRGRWLIAARLSWVLLAITIIALNVIALPSTLFAPLPPDVIIALNRLGFSPTLYNAIGNTENILDLATFLAMAALLFWRKPDDRMAFFGSLTLLAFGGIIGGGLFDTDSGEVVRVLAAIPVIHQVAQALVVVAQSSLITFFYLFPSSRFVPRWTRWCALLMVAYWVVVIFVSPALFTGPLGLMLFVFFATALLAQVYRYLRVSTAKEREQTKWVVFGIVLAVLIIIVPQVLVGQLPQDLQNSLANASPTFVLIFSGRWTVALLLVPISIAVAILRSRLWDIDVIINKALVYGSLTALLAAIYAGLVIGMETLMRRVTGQADQPPAVIVISTLVIAALFQPLRYRIQRFIDRRFYRGKYDSARTLAAFGTTLRTETDLVALSDRLILAVQETMHPSHASLWLRDSTPRRSGEAGEESR